MQMNKEATLSRVSYYPDQSIDLMEVAAIFLVEWRLGLAWTTGTLAVGVIALLLVTPLFEATASLLPPDRGASSAAVIFSAQSPGDVFVGLLGSRSVADDVVERLGLATLYRTPSKAQARATLAKRSTFAAGRDTIVTIRVRDRSAEAAARIANAYLDALESQQQRMAVHDAEIRRQFFAQALAQETAALSEAEQSLTRVQQATGVVQPEAQTQLGLTAIAAARAEVASLQVQLAGLLLSESESNPEVKQLRSALARRQAQERQLEASEGSNGTGAAASASRMPELNLDVARRSREVKYHQALADSIAHQYEAARLGADGAGPAFQIVDRAVPPETKAWPPRALLLPLLMVLSGVVGVLAIAFLLLARRILSDPLQRERLRTIRGSFRSAR